MTSIHACSPPGGSPDSGSTSPSAGRSIVDMVGTVFVMGMVMLGLQCNHVELAVADAAFGHQRVGKLSDIGRCPLEDDAFQTIVVIEMTVHGRHRQIVVIMLQPGQALGQFPLVMVVDVGEVGDAMTAWRLALAVALD